MAQQVIPEVIVLEDGDTLESPVIFISEYRGLQVLDDQPKPICRFSPFSVLHPVHGAISKGHYLCKSKKIFDRLTKHPSFGKVYKIVKRLPRETDRLGGVIQRGVSTGAGRELAELNEEERLMYRQLVELEAKYFTKDSDYTVMKESIKNEETKNRIHREISAIKNKLNLK